MTNENFQIEYTSNDPSLFFIFGTGATVPT